MNDIQRVINQTLSLRQPQIDILLLLIVVPQIIQYRYNKK